MRAKRKAVFFTAAAAAISAIGTFAPPAHADFSWVPTGATGGGSWDQPSNWLENGNPAAAFPNGAGVVVNITNDISAGATISMPNPSVTIGVLNIGDAGPTKTNLYTIQNNSILFDNGTNPGEINKTGLGAASTARDSIPSNISLPAAGLTLNGVASDGSVANSVFQLRGQISGTGGLIKVGNGSVSINAGAAGNNIFTGTTIIKAGRLRTEGSANVIAISGDLEIWNLNTFQSTANNTIAPTSNVNLPVDTSVTNNAANGGFFNGGFNGVDVTIDGGTTGSITQARMGSLEGTAFGSQVSGGRGTITIGGNNLDKTFSGRLGARSSFTKIGTGTQVLAGQYNNWEQSATATIDGVPLTPIHRNFTVLGGRLELNKTTPIGGTYAPAAIAQQYLYIGDGLESGATRPEVRWLNSHQAEVQFFDDGVNPVTRTETNVARLNSGVMNLNGFAETIATVQGTGSGISTLALGNNGQLNLNTGMTVDVGATLEVTSTNLSRPAVKTAALTVNGKLDLQDNKLAVVGGSESVINALVASGRNGGGWDGAAGIITTQTDAAAASQLTTIGVNTAAVAKNISGTSTATFGGQTVSPTDILAMYTYAGDATLDGQINGDDFQAIDAGYSASGTTYAAGDFNYSGGIDADDYFMIDVNYGRQGAPISSGASAGVTAVPEPAGLSVLGLAAAGALRRKRRAM